MRAEETLRLATAFFDAIEQGDLQAVADCYDDDVVVWHNIDRLETNKNQNLAVLEQFCKIAPARRYMDRRLEVFPGGFVQQHVLEARLANTRLCELHACLVCAVSERGIVRLDEYFDSAELEAFRS